MRISGGIDVGKTETRQVYLELGWKSAKVTESSRSARTVASVPSSLLTFRHFSLPFTDRKRVREIIKEELSDTIAFPMEEAIWDSYTSPKGEIFVIITRQKMLQEMLQQYPANYQMLDAEPCALARCALYSGIKDGLIIDFGASKTVFCGLREGHIDLIKVLLKGGDFITETLASEMKLSSEEAEQLKRGKGLGSPVVKDLIIRLMRSANLPLPFPYPAIVISGRGAQMEGLKNFLEESLKTPVTTFKLPEGLSPYAHPVAFGMALNEKEHGISVNLMEEKKVETGSLKPWIIAILIPIIIMSASLKLRESNLKHEIKNYTSEMETIVKKEFPEIKYVREPVSQFREQLESKKLLLQGQGTDLLNTFDQIAKVISGKDIKIYEIDLNESTLTLTGETSSYQEIELLRKKLAESFKKAELREGKTLPSKRITFTIILTSGEKGAESDGKA